MATNTSGHEEISTCRLSASPMSSVRTIGIYQSMIIDRFPSFFSFFFFSFFHFSFFIYDCDSQCKSPISRFFYRATHSLTESRRSTDADQTESRRSPVRRNPVRISRQTLATQSRLRMANTQFDSPLSSDELLAWQFQHVPTEVELSFRIAFHDSPAYSADVKAPA